MTDWASVLTELVPLALVIALSPLSIIPAVLVLSTIDHGDSTFYFRVAGIVGLCILAAMALARVLAWYVFRFGRGQLEKQGFRAAWEIAWKPVLMLIVMIYAIIGIPLAIANIIVTAAVIDSSAEKVTPPEKRAPRPKW